MGQQPLQTQVLPPIRVQGAPVVEGVGRAGPSYATPPTPPMSQGYVDGRTIMAPAVMSARGPNPYDGRTMVASPSTASSVAGPPLISTDVNPFASYGGSPRAVPGTSPNAAYGSYPAGVPTPPMPSVPT